MNQTKTNKVQGTLQIIAIVILILSVLSTALTLIIQFGVTSAASDGKAPNIFGTSYLVSTDEKFEELSIKTGSLVLLEEGATDIAVGDVIAFITPSANKSNEAYSGYSLGLVSDIYTDSSDNSVYYTISGLGDSAEFAVAATTTVGIATTQVVFFGSIIALMAAASGLIYFIIIPFFLYIILQLFVIILRTVFSDTATDEPDEEDDDDEVVPSATTFGHAPIAPAGPVSRSTQEIMRPIGLGNTDHSKFDTVRLTQETLQPLVRERSKYDTTTRLNQEPLQPLSLKFESKTKASFEKNPTQTFQSPTAPTEEVPTIKRVFESPLKEIKPASQPVPQPVEKTGEDFHSVMDMVDSLLNDIQKIQDTEREIAQKKVVSAPTLPVEPTEEELAQKESIKDTQSQELLENILVELKDNALD